MSFSSLSCFLDPPPAQKKLALLRTLWTRTRLSPSKNWIYPTMLSPFSAVLPQALNRTLPKLPNPRQGPHLCWCAGSEWKRRDLRPWRVAGLAAAAKRQEEEAVHHAGSISELLLQEERGTPFHPQVAALLSWTLNLESFQLIISFLNFI